MKSILDRKAARTADHDSLALKAYLTMRQRIVGGEFALGQVISRRRIAAELGISFMPASEALLRLECDGLLEKRPRSGTRIRIPTRQNVAGHFVLREALEVQSAMLLGARATSDQKTTLLSLAKDLDLHTVQPGGDPFLYSTLHETLHLRLAECTGCTALLASLDRVSALASTWLREMKAAIPQDPPGHHETLVDALINTGPDAAAGTMRSHIRSNAVAVMRILEPFFQLHKEYKATYSRTLHKAPETPSRSWPSPSPAPSLAAPVENPLPRDAGETSLYSSFL